MVRGCYERARGLLSGNMNALHAIAGKLLEKEALDGQEIDVIIRESMDEKGAAMQ